MALGIRLAGFEIRDSIAWVYGSGFPKSRRFALDIDKRMGAESEVVGQTYATAKGIKGAEDRSEAGAGAYAKAGVIDLKEPTSPEAREWAGWGTALKPAMEPIVMAQKPFPGTVADNVLTWRTGGFNIDDSRVPYNGEVPNLGGRGNHGRGDGYGFNPQGEAATANTKGRHPANFIHDGSQGVLDLFPDSNGSGSAARFFYCPKPSSTERDMGLDGFTPDEAGGEKGNGLSRVCVKCGTPQLKASACPSPDACPRSWEVPRFTPQEWDSDGAAIPSRANRPNAPRLNTHETLKPVALMRYLVRLVTPPGGTVLDPFTGSGTTGIASLAEGFSFIGMEQEAKYARIAKTRILCGNTLRVSG
jgi:site-specific DNA-methyltransferase (adenine-specific)